ncbi:MAG: alpha/beta hydrolase [Acidimicrobiales bacterium]
MELEVPEAPWAAAVLLHPHPSFGGDRHNIVVDALFRALPSAGVAALRFDFASPDVAACAAQAVAALDALDVRPLVLAGYSFGAEVASNVADERLAGWALIAPPTLDEQLGADSRPKLVLAAAHDQFAPPDRLVQRTSQWASTSVEIIEAADHFLAGATRRVAERVVEWLRERTGR